MLKADLTMAGRLRESYLKVQMGRRLVAGRLLIGILQPGLGGGASQVRYLWSNAQNA